MFDSRPLLLFSFDTDLTDTLLTALPDFESLQAFISTSKFVYSVFQSRQNSILAAVACSQFGPALPQAMRLVRFLDGTYSTGSTHGLHLETDFAQDLMITPAQARLLRDHAATVRALEDIYSWREKDPRSENTQLTTAESLRFQQSIYRFWLLVAAYGPGALVDGSSGNSDGGHLQLKDSIVAKQASFLMSFGEFELLGIDEAHGFLLDLARWAVIKHTTRPTHVGYDDDVYLVWSGPAVTLDAFEGGWSFRSIGSQWCDGWRAMAHAFLASEAAPVARGGVPSTNWRRFILDDHFLRTIDCSRCDEPHSLSRRDSLWSFCNWEYMILAIAPSRLASFLSYERRPLKSLISFMEAVELIPYPQLIGEIFDIRSGQYRDWKKDDWLCTRCMTELLSDNVQAWFYERTIQH